MKNIIISILGLAITLTGGTLVKKEFNKSEHSHYIKGLDTGNENGYNRGFTLGYETGKKDCENSYSQYKDFIFSGSFATLDTVYVRHLLLRAEEWYWLKGNWTPQTPAEKQTWKRIRVALLAAAPPTNATNVTIDSVSGRVALYFYTVFLTSSKSETSNMTNNISQNIKAYTPMVLFTDRVDANYLLRFQNGRDNGKDDFNN